MLNGKELIAIDKTVPKQHEKKPKKGKRTKHTLRRKDPATGRKLNLSLITEITVKTPWTIQHVLRKINTCFQLPYACVLEDSRVKPELRVFSNFSDVSVTK